MSVTTVNSHLFTELSNSQYSVEKRTLTGSEAVNKTLTCEIVLTE